MTEKNPYNKRFGWWYPAIADWLLSNPHGTIGDCARALKKSEPTISLIKNSDLFRDYFAVRRREWEERHDFKIREKLHGVADLGLDILLETMKTKRDSVPIARTTEIVTSALDRLGYAPQTGPSTQINLQANAGSKVVVAPVTVDRLEEARQVLRRAQAGRATEPSNYLPPPSLREAEAREAEPLTLEDEGGPLTISSE